MADRAYRRSTRYPELFSPAGSSKWWAFVPNPDGGKALRIRTGHTDELAAHRFYLDHVRGERAQPVELPQERRENEIGLGAALAKHLEDVAARGRSEGTLDHYDKKSKPLVAYFGQDLPLSSLTARTVDAYVKKRLDTPVAVRRRDGVEALDRKITRSTVARELLVLKKTLRLVRRLGFDAPDPALVMPIGFGLGYKPKERRLNEKQVDLLLKALVTPNHRATAALIVALGATYPSELEDFSEANVDRRKWIVHVQGTKRQTRDRHIPVPVFARRWLRQGLAGLPLRPWTSVRRDLHAACARAGIPHVTPNDLRRTMGSILRARGAAPSLIGLYLGHADSRMAERVYGRVTPEEMAALLRKVG
jgi:integrase